MSRPWTVSLQGEVKVDKSSVETWKLCRDKERIGRAIEELCRDRKFSVVIDFPKFSIATENSLS